MPNQHYSGTLTQAVFDTDISEIFKIPINSKSKFETPLIRIKYIELLINPATVAAWAAVTTSLEFVLERYPTQNRAPVKLCWQFARYLTGGAGAAYVECSKTWDMAGHSLPVLSANQWQVSLKTTGTGVVNEVKYLMYYEEIENPTELELTLALR